MRDQKKAGEVKRDKTDKFYLGLVLALRQGLTNLAKIKNILSETFPDLDFSGLNDIYFVGESTYLDFSDMFVQIRRSGTDAKMRGYACGQDKKICQTYLDKLLHYEGQLVDSYKQAISDDFYNDIYKISDQIYKAYFYKDLWLINV